MVNLTILGLFALILLATRRHEGTVKVGGLFSVGLVCARVGPRVGMLVCAYRPNRIYWRLYDAGGAR